MRVEFYDKGSRVFKSFLDKNQIKYNIFTPFIDLGDQEEAEWFDIDNVSKHFNITLKK